MGVSRWIPSGRHGEQEIPGINMSTIISSCYPSHLHHVQLNILSSWENTCQLLLSSCIQASQQVYQFITFQNNWGNPITNSGCCCQAFRYVNSFGTNPYLPSFPPVALGRRAAEESAGFLGTFGTLKVWAEEERFPSTLSSSSKLRSSGRGRRIILGTALFCGGYSSHFRVVIFLYKVLQSILHAILIEHTIIYKWKQLIIKSTLTKKLYFHLKHLKGLLAELEKARGKLKRKGSGDTPTITHQTHTWQNRDKHLRTSPCNRELTYLYPKPSGCMNAEMRLVLKLETHFQRWCSIYWASPGEGTFSRRANTQFSVLECCCLDIEKLKAHALFHAAHSYFWQTCKKKKSQPAMCLCVIVAPNA